MLWLFSEISPPSKLEVVSFDLYAIDKRIEDLHQQYSSTAYAKKKASLKEELEGFLSALPGQKCFTNALPIDICQFLVFWGCYRKDSAS